MGAFKLGKMTFGSLFKKPETVKYPYQKKPQPEGLKGHIVIDAGECILCGMCDRSCSTGCLSVDKGASTWSIDRFACVQCGYCITVCPKKCLSMDPDYAPVAVERSVEAVNVPAQGKPAPAKAKPADPEPEPEPELESRAAVTDAQVEALVGLMGDEAAAKVRKALA